jgi:DNA repair exonuclease SbcCD ATPase subunit
MKNINFQRAGAQNFCCYKEEIDYKFDNNKIILITGPNGSGKSTLFDIIPFTFWGVTTKELKADDVVNNEVGKNCHTFVEFNIGEDQYRVDRYVKDSKLSNTVILKKNTETIKRGHREVSAEIDSLLMPQKLFMNTLLFGQKVKTFFTDLTDSEQKDIFRKVLQLDEYDLYYKKTSEKLKEIEGELNRNDVSIEIVEKLIAELDDQYNQLLDSKRDFEIKKDLQLKQFSANIFKLTADMKAVLDLIKNEYQNNLEEEIKNINDILSKATAEKNAIKKEEESKIKDLKQKCNVKEMELKNKADQSKSSLEKAFAEAKSAAVSALNTQESSIQKKISEISSKLSVSQADSTSKENHLRKIQNEATKIKDSLNKDDIICPLCHQTVGSSSVVHLKEELKSREIEIEIIKRDLTSASDIVRKLLTEKDSLETTLRVLRNDFSNEIKELEKSHNDKILIVNKKIADVLSQLAEIVKRDTEKIQVESLDILNNLEKDLNQYANRINELNTKVVEKKKAESTVKDIESQINTFNALKDDLEKSQYDDKVLKKTLETKNDYGEKIKINLEKKAELIKKIKVLEFWKSGFSMSGIPSMLIDEAIPFMNQRVMFYLEQIGGRYMVSFDTMATTKAGEFRDKISVNVLDTKTKANMRKQLSGGQTRVVDIATILTLRDLQSNIQGVTTNIIMLDEIFDSLDDQNISYVSGLIRQLAKGQSTHIISHRQIDQIDADEVFTTFN